MRACKINRDTLCTLAFTPEKVQPYHTPFQVMLYAQYYT